VIDLSLEPTCEKPNSFAKMCTRGVTWFTNPEGGEFTPTQLWDLREDLTKHLIIVLGRLTVEIGSRFESPATLPHYMHLMHDTILKLKNIDSNWHLVYSAEKEDCLRIMQHDCRCGFKNRRRKQLQ